MLSHPLLVEAIASEFAPVAIYNNAKGRDERVRERYSEKAWNNPVVRFLDREGKDLLPRQGGIYSVAGIATRMVRALEAAKRPVPGYLRLLVLDDRPAQLRRAAFAMY